MTVDLKALAAEFPRDVVSWRAQSLTKDGSKAMALAYIDARDVMERLDAVCGPDGWQCDYPHAATKTVCRIGIKVGDEWVWKANGAGDSDIEAEKGALSDAFKRAAVLWGIGRYLYATETPWVPCESYETEYQGKKKWNWKRWTVDPWSCVVRRSRQPSAPASSKSLAYESHAANLRGAATMADLLTAFTEAKEDKSLTKAEGDDLIRIKDERKAALTQALPLAKNLGEHLDRLATEERMQ